MLCEYLLPELCELIFTHLDLSSLISTTCVSSEFRELALLTLSKLEKRKVPYTHQCALDGHLSLIKWCTSNDDLLDGGVSENAALNGHLKILKWLRANYRLNRTLAANGAALRGHLEILKWIKETRYSFWSDTSHNAAEGGHVEILQWLRDNGYPWDEKTCAHAAKGGNLETLQWLCNNKCRWDKNTWSYAALGGHLHILEWLDTQDFLCDEYVCVDNASQNGHIHILEWFKDRGYNKWGSVSTAAAAGQLETVKWLVANGDPSTSMAMACAAESGHLEVVQWLRENNVPWYEGTCKYVFKFGRRMDILKWLIDNGCPSKYTYEEWLAKD